jgi:hypothetical protein
MESLKYLFKLNCSMNNKGNIFFPTGKKKTAYSEENILKLKEINEEFMTKIKQIVEPLVTKYEKLTANNEKLEEKDFKIISNSIQLITTYETIEKNLSKGLKQQDLLQKMNNYAAELKEITDRYSIKYNKLRLEDPHLALRELHIECEKLLLELAKLEREL